MADDIELYVAVAGEPVLLRKLATVQKGLEDWTPIWEKVAAWFYQMEATQFATEGHGEWEALADSTVMNRLRRGYGGAHPILEMTGKLAASLLGGEHHVRIETPTEIQLGSSLRVGKWNLAMLHHTGTYRMPSRPVIGRKTKKESVVLHSEDATKLRSIFSEYVHAIVTAK